MTPPGLLSGVTGTLRAWHTRLRGLHGMVLVEDVPDVIAPRTLYVVGENGHRWYAVFACPCGCGAPIHASLLARSSPHWTLSEHWDGTVSLHPSVWRTKGCRSHFWLKRGRVRWCRP